MAISNFGELKAKLSSILFHTRFVSEYANSTLEFEASANRRLRVRPMEASTLLTTVAGEVDLPANYLVWRTVMPANRTRFPPSNQQLDYVHPAYLPVTSNNRYPPVFTIEGALFKTRPVNDAADGYEFHYYQKIPTITGGDADTNWLLTDNPDVYVAGVMTELFILQRNMEGAQLEKARRDELFAEISQLHALTTGATSPMMRTAEYF